MTTYTADAFLALPKAVHVGVNHIHAQFSFAGEASQVSAGDIVLLARLPHGATIVEVAEDHTTGASTAVVDVGLLTGAEDGGGSSLSAFVAAAGKGTVNRRATVAPYSVSVSDSAAARYGVLAAKIASIGTATSVCAINVSVLYRLD